MESPSIFSWRQSKFCGATHQSCTIRVALNLLFATTCAFCIQINIDSLYGARAFKLRKVAIVTVSMGKPWFKAWHGTEWFLSRRTMAQAGVHSINTWQRVS